MLSCSRHIFAVGNAAYQTMFRTENKQAIIISGESGAGKTESTRLLVEFLAAVSQTSGSLVTKQVHITGNIIIIIISLLLQYLNIYDIYRKSM